MTQEKRELTVLDIDNLWIRRMKLHDGDLMPQLRDFARAIIAADRALNTGMETMWTECVFDGQPPSQYRDWGDFIGSKTKSHVYIREAMPSDFTSRVEQHQQAITDHAAIATHEALKADAGVMRQAVTEEMVTAYLTANDKYWRETDELPSKKSRRWRQGTPSEATRVSLEAALAAAPTPPAEQQSRGSQESRWNEHLLAIIASVYQILGALNAPAHILDVLSDPLGATDAQIDSMLPFVPAKQQPDDITTIAHMAGVGRGKELALQELRVKVEALPRHGDGAAFVLAADVLALLGEPR